MTRMSGGSVREAKARWFLASILDSLEVLERDEPGQTWTTLQMMETLSFVLEILYGQEKEPIGDEMSVLLGTLFCSACEEAATGCTCPGGPVNPQTYRSACAKETGNG